LGEGLVEKLTAAGVSTVEALADMTPEQLEAIEGIGPKTVEKISLAVNNYFASLEQGEAVAAEGEVAVEGVAAEEAAGVEAAVEGEAAAESAAGEDETGEVAAAPETTEETAVTEEHEHKPEDGSAPETTK
jgi:N utilization substance protein A